MAPMIGARHARLVQQPGERDLGRRHASGRGDLDELVDHVEVGLARRAVGERVVRRPARCAAAPSRVRLPVEEAAGERAPRDQADALVEAERDHLPLLLAVDQVVVVLHRHEPGRRRDRAAPSRTARRTCSTRRCSAPCRRGRRRAAPPSSPRSGCPGRTGGSGRGPRTRRRAAAARRRCRRGCACATGRASFGPGAHRAEAPWWRGRSPRGGRSTRRSSSPVTSSLTPSEYTSAVSKKLMPGLGRPADERLRRLLVEHPVAPRRGRRRSSCRDRSGTPSDPLRAEPHVLHAPILGLRPGLGIVAAGRDAMLTEQLPLGCGHVVVPDRGRRHRGRPRTVHLGHVQPRPATTSPTARPATSPATTTTAGPRTSI